MSRVTFLGIQMGVIEYVTEEVRRQGHDIHTLDGIERVGWMLDAWSQALLWGRLKPELGDAIELGRMVEREKNRNGLRTVNVWVGDRPCPPPSEIEARLTRVFELRVEMSPLQFYREFEEVHPFVDGNGRTGKILLNWLNGTLLTPIFPPDDFWGRPITNP